MERDRWSESLKEIETKRDRRPGVRNPERLGEKTDRRFREIQSE